MSCRWGSSLSRHPGTQRTRFPAAASRASAVVHRSAERGTSKLCFSSTTTVAGGISRRTPLCQSHVLPSP
jgi:hypothetical protein